MCKQPSCNNGIRDPWSQIWLNYYVTFIKAELSVIFDKCRALNMMFDEMSMAPWINDVNQCSMTNISVWEKKDMRTRKTVAHSIEGTNTSVLCSISFDIILNIRNRSIQYHVFLWKVGPHWFCEYLSKLWSRTCKFFSSLHDRKPNTTLVSIYQSSKYPNFIIRTSVIDDCLRPISWMLKGWSALWVWVPPFPG